MSKEYPSFPPGESSWTGNIPLFPQGNNLEYGISLFSPRGIILNREYSSLPPGESSWTGNIPLFPQGNHLEQGISLYSPRGITWTGNIHLFPPGNHHEQGISFFSSPRKIILNMEYPSVPPGESSWTGKIPLVPQGKSCWTNIPLFTQENYLEQGISDFFLTGIISNREYPSFSHGESSWTRNIPLFHKGNHLGHGISLFSTAESSWTWNISSFPMETR